MWTSPDNASAIVKALGKRITTCAAMGDLPFLCEGVRATVRLPAPKGGGAWCAVVTPLDGNGRAQGAPRVVTCVDGFATFEISEAFRTVWYRVAFRTANDAWSAGRAGAPPSQMGGEATRPPAN